MFDDTGRRRFLQVAGAGTALSLSGCSALSDNDGGESGGGSGSGEAEPATVTLAVRPDQEELQELQSEIQSQVESGELDRMQAQSTFRRRRIELTKEAVGTFQNRTGNTSVTIDNTVDEFGVMLITGPPAAVLETLDYEEVSGLFPESAFERAREQSGGTTESETPTPE